MVVRKDVADVMTTGVLSFPPDAWLDEIARKMYSRNISSVYIYDPRTGRRGVVTDTDILKVVGKKKLEKVKAREVMSKKIIGITKETTLEEAVNLMRTKKVRRLFVFNDLKDKLPIGVLSVTDILLELAKETSLKEGRGR